MSLSVRLVSMSMVIRLMADGDKCDVNSGVMGADGSRFIALQFPYQLLHQSDQTGGHL